MTVYEIGRIGCKEHSRPHQILRCAPTRSRGLGDDELVERMTASVRLYLSQRCSLVSGDITGTDAITLYIVLSELRTYVAGQHLEAALGGSEAEPGFY